MYDEEAIYQEADIEQAEMIREANYLAALRKRGICTHQSAVGLPTSGEIFYPEQHGLLPGQLRCTEGCGEVFQDDEAWYQAMRAL